MRPGQTKVLHSLFFVAFGSFFLFLMIVMSSLEVYVSMIWDVFLLSSLWVSFSSGCISVGHCMEMGLEKIT
jgi:hypothetical protein